MSDDWYKGKEIIHLAENMQKIYKLCDDDFNNLSQENLDKIIDEAIAQACFITVINDSEISLKYYEKLLARNYYGFKKDDAFEVLYIEKSQIEIIKKRYIFEKKNQICFCSNKNRMIYVKFTQDEIIVSQSVVDNLSGLNFEHLEGLDFNVTHGRNKFSMETYNETRNGDNYAEMLDWAFKNSGYFSVYVYFHDAKMKNELKPYLIREFETDDWYNTWKRQPTFHTEQYYLANEQTKNILKKYTTNIYLNYNDSDSFDIGLDDIRFFNGHLMLLGTVSHESMIEIWQMDDEIKSFYS